MDDLLTPRRERRLRPCKACAQPIAKTARVCPHCGQPYTQAAGVMLAVLVAVVLGGLYIIRR